MCTGTQGQKGQTRPRHTQTLILTLNLTLSLNPITNPIRCYFPSLGTENVIYDVAVLYKVLASNRDDILSRIELGSGLQ